MRCVPLSEENWKDFKMLFGPRGACAGCWCMYWRIPRKTWEKGKGDGNRKRMKSLVHTDTFTGCIGYLDKKPVAWCSLGPRKFFPVLNNSKILAPVDDEPVWSIVCFFIHKNYRKRGLTSLFLEKIKKIARKKGANILEGYPVDPGQDNYPSTFAFTGFYNAFVKAGFTEFARRSPTRPIMRYIL